MTFEPRKVRDSYRNKVPSYESKYNYGYYTHIHTGYYTKTTFPFVTHASTKELQRLGESKIRHYLHWGQELLLNKLLRDAFAEPSNANVLDCGAGHGGTVLYIADNFRVPVVALTISEDQAAIINRRVAESGRDKLISVECSNVFDVNLPQNFTHIIGVDAFCQMGEPNRLMQKLGSLLLPGGFIVVSDYFVRRKDSDIAKYFDSYWSSNITTQEESLSAAWQIGLVIHSFRDITQYQIPFWRLSIAHSDLLIQKSSDEAEIKRLRNSKAFHAAMEAAFATGDLLYAQFILRLKA